MPRLAVVLDTNVLRGIGPVRFAALRDREANHSIIGYTTYATAIELLSHLKEPDSREGKASAAAAERLIHRCTYSDGHSNVVRFVVEPRAQIAGFLFKQWPKDIETAHGYGHVLGTWITSPERRDAFKPLLEEISQHADDVRAKYVAGLWHSVVLTMNPDATDWSDAARPSAMRTALLQRITTGDGKRAVALSIAREAAAEVGRTILGDEEQHAIDLVLENFGTIVEYRHEVITGVIRDGPNMAKRFRANGAFDMHICGATGRLARLNEVPILMVTDDGDVLGAAKRSSMQHLILTLNDYEELLGMDLVDVSNMVAAIREEQQARVASLNMSGY